MSRRPINAIAANPVLIGAATLLVTVVAVFLAYNANNGIPFVPTYDFKVEAPSGARLVVGNEVREGGTRIGQVTQIEPTRIENGTGGATLTLNLEQSTAPIPSDSTILIRPRSTLGLKYVDFIRGESDQMLPEGATIAIGEGAIPPELDAFFDMFDEPTRRFSRENLVNFGGGFAARGDDLNRTFAALPQLLGDLPSPMRKLADPDTRLRNFIDELEDAARVVAPVSEAFARGFTAGADTFEAFSRDPEALEQTIAEGPETLEVGRRALRAQRPFLRRLAGISDEIQGTAREVRRSVPPINEALAAGTEVLPRTPELNEDLERAFEGVLVLARSPTTDLTLSGLTSTMDTLRPTLRWVGPHITVCNYWNYWWTYLSDHLSERNDTGTIQRIQAKSAPNQENDLKEFGATEPVNGPADPISQRLFGDPADLHGQVYGRAVDSQGRADCESGQRGYPKRLAKGAPAGLDIAVDPRTPGNQGPTFTGRPRVPRGQTFSAEPLGRAPKIAGTEDDR